MPPSDTPLALIGYPSPAARALRDLGLIAVNVPTGDLRGVLDACRTLQFSGALVHPSQETHALDAVTPDPVARRVGRVDAVSLSGQPRGTFAFSDALTDALDASGYASRGASALILGLDAHDLALALPLARLGFTELGLAAESIPEAERAARDLPAARRAYPLSRRDPSVSAFAARADLLILTAGTMPAGMVQPYHTVIDLTGRASVTGTGASSVDLRDLPLRRLARQLEHATGQRFHPQGLEGALQALA
ncbi:shikimate dehydrogenase [Deinococcus taeanensis]|uniref:shikimate dehydrogenase n=1 Tax=Deinococcus taeanensis TaxID=2737050 RepID=UPI001CDB73A8|nr:shikimate dehydrogenase [Deinococcus taeanensis]UBV43589.1 shikimate dehydrogenase [Deinococcus taeanensis]